MGSRHKNFNDPMLSRRVIKKRNVRGFCNMPYQSSTSFTICYITVELFVNNIPFVCYVVNEQPLASWHFLVPCDEYPVCWWPKQMFISILFAECIDCCSRGNISQRCDLSSPGLGGPCVGVLFGPFSGPLI